MPSSSTDDAVYLALRSETCYTAAMQQIHTALHEGPWFDDDVFDRTGRGAPRRTFPHSLADLWPREPCYRCRGRAADRPERRGREGASPGTHRLSRPDHRPQRLRRSGSVPAHLRARRRRTGVAPDPGARDHRPAGEAGAWDRREDPRGWHRCRPLGGVPKCRDRPRRRNDGHLQKEELTVVQRLRAFLDTDTDHRLALRHRAERPPTRIKIAFQQAA